MKHARRIIKSNWGVVCAALIAASIPDNANAYLDPGTGSVVLQVVVAGILGAVFTCKNYLRAAYSSVTRLFRKSDSSSDA